MKKLLYLLFAICLIGCASDDNLDENGFNPSLTLRENLASNTSPDKLYYERDLTQTGGLSFTVAFFFNRGYVINSRYVTNDWGRNGENYECITADFSTHPNYNLDNMLILKDSQSEFSWSTISSSPATFSVSLSNNTIVLKNNKWSTIRTFTKISDTQKLDYLNKEATYEICP